MWEAAATLPDWEAVVTQEDPACEGMVEGGSILKEGTTLEGAT